MQQVPTVSSRRAFTSAGPAATAPRRRRCRVAVVADGSHPSMPESWGRRSLLAATAGGAAAAALASVPWPALALDRTTAPAAGGMPAATQPPLPLVNAQWLDQNLGRVKLLDAAWYLNAPGKGAAEFQARRIPGARFFDLDAIADPSTPAGLQSMLPQPVAFGAAADALGIGRGDTVVVYDHTGEFTAPRAWWTWHVMGHDNVLVLDGGLPAWKAAGGELDATPVSQRSIEAPAAALRRAASQWGGARPRYQARLRVAEVRDWADIVRILGAGGEQIVDARPAAKYRGQVAESHGVRPGHIPGALSLPAQSLVADGRFLAPTELHAKFAAAGVDLSRPITAYCETGIMASAVALAARLAAPAAPLPAVYDGSWLEWGSLPGLPVQAERSPAQDFSEPIKRLA